MSDTPTPIRTLISQGWEVVHYNASYDHTAGLLHAFLMRRATGAMKVVTVRKKMMGEGLVVEEMEV